MLGYKTNLPLWPVLGVPEYGSFPEVGDLVTIYDELPKHEKTPNQEFQRSNFLCRVMAIDHDAMTVQLEELKTNVLYNPTRDLAHGEVRDAWGKTQRNRLVAQAQGG